ncbi:MATH and LRR domain-containing protein PFE0570w-like [Plodia interpunctella]|uniref:MATH and LRR domain-containing protein PFE0570w-like n=1 Tax=Plodia interpunctella TaxID=58824 RepID=UPI0023681211|nr:MATH and LRR domain-containing protein PFE0570w-like [Plodia interpunctella]
MICIFILCCIVPLISANPLAKLLLQTRSNSNQNGFNNVPYNLPIPANNIQSYIPPNIIQNPVNYCPCNQPYGSQNGLPVQIKVEGTNKSFLNKILANPMFQSILDPNGNNFNLDNNNFAPQGNNGQKPNVINNYYIIPPECAQDNDKGIEMIKNLIENKTVVSRNVEKRKNNANERKNVPRPQNKQNHEIEKPKANKRVQNGEHGHKTRINDNTQPKREKSKKKKKNGIQRGSATTTHDRNISKNKKISNSKSNNENLPHRKNIASNRTSSHNNGTRKRKNPKTKLENDNQIANDKLSIKSNLESPDVLDNVNGKLKKKQTKVISYTHPRDENVINDIHEKFPGIPKDVINKLLRYLRRQNKIQRLCNRDDLKISTVKNNKENIKTDSDIRKTIKDKSRNSENLALSSTTDHILDKYTPADIKVSNSTYVSSLEGDLNQRENNETVQTFFYKPSTEVVEMTTNKITEIPTRIKEIAVLDTENDMNDYYPDFRFDKMYTSEDDYIRSLRNDKFYYTTDRNIYDINKSTEIYYEPYKLATPKKELQSEEFEDTLNNPIKYYENYDDEALNSFSSEEVEFQTPPFLENPDFETKPVVKYFGDETPTYTYQVSKNDNLNVKSSTYSNAKSIVPLKEKPRSDNIETVFAGSKVAKYGQPQNVADDNLDKNDNSDTVVVYARSMSDS